MIDKLLKRAGVGFVLSLVVVMFSGEVLAHGERAQLASMRMRTMHWLDFQVSTTTAKVGEIVTIRGSFSPSEHWPEQLPNISDTGFLNVGVPGPAFIRIDSSVNGVPMIRSTAFHAGKVYEYEVVLRARLPGRYHVHPLINVKDAGTLVGKGAWVEVVAVEGDEPFVNNATTMFGEVIDLETHGLQNVINWHIVWIVMGVAWLVFWLARKQLFIPRFMKVRYLKEEANDLITKKDFMVSGVFFTVTLAIILGGYLWAENKFPITIPLQTGKVVVEAPDIPKGGLTIEVKDASYILAGRSLAMHTRMTNNSGRPLRIAEFMTANIRFFNPDVGVSTAYENEEMVAVDGLNASVDVIAPGQTVDVDLVAEDALWEKYRMTGMIHDPDSRFAGIVFYYDDEGNRYFQEIGGPILPQFFD